MSNGKRLENIKAKKVLALGTVITLSASQILERMTEKQIISMFDKNIDAQYILLDNQGRVPETTIPTT